jgi:hypothetical protein
MVMTLFFPYLKVRTSLSGLVTVSYLKGFFPWSEVFEIISRSYLKVKIILIFPISPTILKEAEGCDFNYCAGSLVLGCHGNWQSEIWCSFLAGSG